MKITTRKFRSSNTWIASAYDENDGALLGTAVGYSKEEAAFKLGCEYGRNPQQFARPLSEIFNRELTAQEREFAGPFPIASKGE